MMSGTCVSGFSAVSLCQIIKKKKKASYVFFWQRNDATVQEAALSFHAQFLVTEQVVM
jgi:hypothetical protein